jgi:hypothetical protein
MKKEYYKQGEGSRGKEKKCGESVNRAENRGQTCQIRNGNADARRQKAKDRQQETD